MAKTSPKPGLSVELAFDKARYKATSRQSLVFTLANESDQPVQVLRWHTPLEGFKSDMFEVQTAGAPVPYLGRLYKRGPPLAEDFITLQPGEVVRQSLNFLEGYDVAQAGHYSVRYRSARLHAGVAQPDALARRYLARKPATVTVRANVALFEQVEARSSRLPGAAEAGPAGAAPEALTPSFSGCGTAQQTALASALTAGAKLAAAARDAFKRAPAWGRPNLPRYREWFGAYDRARFDTAAAHFTNIADALANRQVKFFCDCTSNDYAYVYAGKPYEIHLCKAFWAAPLNGTDSQAGTLVHETSHFNVVAATDDHVYGQAGCRSLAAATPADALDNADTHEYFAENTPALAMQPQPGSVNSIAAGWHGLPAGWSGGFDAALNGGGPFAGKCYFFKGASYLRYDWAKDKADAGYPANIAANWHGLPAGFNSGFDAAVNGQGPFRGKCYFFKGDSYLRYDWAADKADAGYPKKVAGNWPGLPVGWRENFDAVLNGNGPFAGKLYFFKGSKYLRYDWAKDKADAGYPADIPANWHGLPTGYTGSFDTALEGDGPFVAKGYFFKGDRYVRYNWAEDCAEI